MVRHPFPQREFTSWGVDSTGYCVVAVASRYPINADPKQNGRGDRDKVMNSLASH